MKPILEHLAKNTGESFVIREFEYNYFPMPWHYHPEYELVYIVKSYGTRFIGNRIMDFGPGNFAFIGQNVPHFYRNHASFYEKNHPERACSQVVHFLPESLGIGFLDLPESAPVKKLLKRAQLGLDIKGNANRQGKRLLDQIFETQGLQRWLLLVDLLLLLAESTEVHSIMQESMVGQNPLDADRLGKVFEYVFLHYKKEISLTEVAELLSLTESSFSRYFKQRTKKCFVDFVTEVRLSEACKLLVGSNITITEICYESGFNNISNFNRHFKRHYGLNPRTYQKRFAKL